MKMRVLLIAGLAGFIGLWAMQPGQPGAEQEPETAPQSEPMITLMSAPSKRGEPGKSFEVPERVAYQSTFISNALGGLGYTEAEERKVTFGNISSYYLAQLIKVMRAVAQKNDAAIQSVLERGGLDFELLHYIGYLEISSVELYGSIGRYIANVLMQSFDNPDEINAIINGINDLEIGNKRQLLSGITEQIKSNIPQDQYVKWEQEHVLQGHNGFVSLVAYSPNGNHVVTGSLGGTARIWNAQTGAQERVLIGLGRGICSVAYSPDGNHIVTGSEDGTARIWNAQTSMLEHELQGHTGIIISVAYSPDGNHIVTGSWDGTARIWNAQTGVQEHELAGHTGWITSVAYSPDGNHIVTGSRDTTARIWNAQTGMQEHELAGHSGFVSSVAYSPDGNHVVTRSEDGTARIWNAQSGALEHVLAGHSGFVSSVAYSSDGNHIVTGSNDGTARIWNVQTGVQEHVLAGHIDRILSVAYSPDGNHIVTGARDGTARIWKRINLVEQVKEFNQALLIYILTQKREQNSSYGLKQLFAEYEWLQKRYDVPQKNFRLNKSSKIGEESKQGLKLLGQDMYWAQKTFNSLPQNFQEFIQEKMSGQEQPTTLMQRMKKWWNK